MNATGVAAIIMALGALVTAVWTILQGKRGARKEEEQASAAAKLADRVQGYDELAGAFDRVEKQLERADAALVEQIERHRAELDRLQITYDRRQGEQSERCRRELGAALDTVKTMHSIVNDEIAKSAALLGEERAGDHLSTDHPEDS